MRISPQQPRPGRHVDPAMYFNTWYINICFDIYTTPVCHTADISVISVRSEESNLLSPPCMSADGAFSSCCRDTPACFAVASSSQVLGVLVRILRVFSCVHDVRHKGVAEEGHAGQEEADIRG